jgi:hypothetical protein
VVGKSTSRGGFLYSADLQAGRGLSATPWGRLADDRLPAGPDRGVAASGLHLGQPAPGLLHRRRRRGHASPPRRSGPTGRRRDRLLRGCPLPGRDRRGADHGPRAELPRGGDPVAVANHQGSGGQGLGERDRGMRRPCPSPCPSPCPRPHPRPHPRPLPKPASHR